MSTDANDRSKAIEAFVERLVRIREEAGRPSFRTMAQRSGAISHATMHDAVQGTRMPSWETTVEFAKSCGVDPRELRADWDQAFAAVRSAGGVHEQPPARMSPAPVSTDPQPLVSAGSPARAVSSPEPAASSTPQLPPAPAVAWSHEPAPTDPSWWQRPRTALLVGASTVAVALAAVLAISVLINTDTKPPTAAATGVAPFAGEATASYSRASGVPTTTAAGGCPGNGPSTGVQAPRMSGDRGKFLRDVSVPDCSTQPRGQSVIKTWQLKNIGTVEWKDRFLTRINTHEGSPGCRAPERVALPDTKPGATVNVSVAVATPNGPATCFARWMQTDAEGNFAFPQQRPYFYSFFVK